MYENRSNPSSHQLGCLKQDGLTLFQEPTEHSPAQLTTERDSVTGQG